MRGRLPHFRGGKWPPFVLALLTFAALTALLLHGPWARQQAAAAPATGSWQAARQRRGPARTWWQTRDLGIFRYDFAGTAMDGEAVVVRVWLKAVIRRQEVLMRAVMWIEPAVAILQHKKRGYLQQPEQAYNDALSNKGFLRLRASGSGTSYTFAVGKVAQADRLIRPLTFSLRLRSTDVKEDRFELRLEGWRKFHMVSLGDLLASVDSIDSGHAGFKPGDDASIGADSFFVVSPRLTAHANATHAAKLMAQHIAHHQQLGFSGHSVFLNREHAGAFMAHPELAGHIQEGRLWLISEDFGMARVAVGAASNYSDRHGRLDGAKKRGELDFSHKALTYAIAQLRHWDGRRRNFITVLDAAEFLVCERGSIQDVASACFRSAGMVLLPLLQTDCGRHGGCGTADDPGTILRTSDRGRVGTKSPDSKPAWRAMALAGAVSGYFLDQGVPEEGLLTQRLGEEEARDQCRAHVVQFTNLLTGPRPADSGPT